jgi:hypothetical protein
MIHFWCGGGVWFERRRRGETKGAEGTPQDSQGEEKKSTKQIQQRRGNVMLACRVVLVKLVFP